MQGKGSVYEYRKRVSITLNPIIHAVLEQPINLKRVLMKSQHWVRHGGRARDEDAEQNMLIQSQTGSGRVCMWREKHGKRLHCTIHTTKNLLYVL